MWPFHCLLLKRSEKKVSLRGLWEPKQICQGHRYKHLQVSALSLRASLSCPSSDLNSSIDSDYLFWDVWVTSAEVSVLYSLTLPSPAREVIWEADGQTGWFLPLLPEEYKAANTTYSSQFVFTISTARFFTRKIRLAFIEPQKKDFSK